MDNIPKYDSMLQTFEWSEHPMNLCAGSRVIDASEFENLAENLLEFPEVKLDMEALLLLFLHQSMRFSACGANNSERFGVLRKNKKVGWQYLIDKIV